MNPETGEIRTFESLGKKAAAEMEAEPGQHEDAPAPHPSKALAEITLPGEKPL